MSLEKKYDDLSLSEILIVIKNQLKNIVQVSISSQIGISQVVEEFKNRVFSTCYSVKRLGIGYKFSEFSIVFKEGRKICVLDLKGLFIEISLNDFSVAHYSIQPQSPRTHFSYSRSNEKIIIFGGKLVGTSHLLADFLIFDTNDKTWISIELETPPLGRYMHATCVLGDFLIVYGGFGHKGWLRDLVLINLQDLGCEKLKTRGFISKTQCWMSAVALKNDIFLLSRNEENSIIRNQMLKLSVRNMIGTLSEVKVSSEVFIENILSLNCINGEVVAVGVSCNNFVVSVYNTVLDCWKQAKVFDDNEQGIKLDEEGIIPVLYQSEVFLVHFYSVFTYNLLS